MPPGVAASAGLLGRVPLESVAPAPRGLVGQGFQAPDFDVRHLQQTLSQMAEHAQLIGKAAGRSEESLAHAAAAAEQAARHADMASRMPSAELPSEAFGDVEGFFPPRYRWGSDLLGGVSKFL
mmetsp:Transcript_36586/g.105401  ORF Transcript_36586/g.105401 Transcript_36586/m.105401 type:complete len:123 (-) Transcript_36586:301-669(-)